MIDLILIKSDNDDDEEITCLDDLESGSTQMMPQATAQIYNRPPLSIIIPVYRYISIVFFFLNYN